MSWAGSVDSLQSLDWTSGLDWWTGLKIIGQMSQPQGHTVAVVVSSIMTQHDDISPAPGVADNWSTICPCEWEYTT